MRVELDFGDRSASASAGPLTHWLLNQWLRPFLGQPFPAKPLSLAFTRGLFVVNDGPRRFIRDNRSLLGFGQRLVLPVDPICTHVASLSSRQQKRPERNRADLPDIAFTPMPVHPWSEGESD